jgi:cytochrome P450 family 2 subfamily F
MENLILDEVAHFTTHLHQFSGQPLDMGGRFNLPILNALWRITVGERFEYDDPKLVDIIQRLDELFKRSTGPSVLFMLTQPWIFHMFPSLCGRDETLKLHRDLRELMKDKVDQHLQTIDYNAEPRDFIDQMLGEIQKTKDEQSSFYGAKGRENLISNLVDLFQAGENLRLLPCD